MEHICLYCGREIRMNEILFTRRDSTTHHDALRTSFKNKCWEQGFGTDAYHERYYRPLGEERDYCTVTQTDQDGYPTMIEVHPDFKGLTPAELVQGAQAAPARAQSVLAGSHYAAFQFEDNADSSEVAAATLPQETASLYPTVQQAESEGLTLRKVNGRACPHCHNPLPQKFGTIPTVSVMLMGGRAAGKTAFLLAQEHCLADQLNIRGLGKVALLPPSKDFYTFQNDFALTLEGAPKPTPLFMRLFPFVYHYTGPDNAECYISINDLAGECLEPQNHEELLNNQALSKSKILLLMMDTNMLNRGKYYNDSPEGQRAALMREAQKREAQEAAEERAQAEPETTAWGAPAKEAERSDALSPEMIAAAAQGQKSHDCYKDPIPEFFSYVREVMGSGVMDSVRHVVAVTTKIDLPLTQKHKRFLGDCELMYNLQRDGELEHQGAFDEFVAHRLAMQIRRYYKSPDEGTEISYDILQELQNVFPGRQIYLHAVSTRTLRPERTAEGKPVFENVYDPAQPMCYKHRIGEPFMRVLAISGKIPTRDMKQGQAEENARQEAEQEEREQEAWEELPWWKKLLRRR